MGRGDRKTLGEGEDPPERMESSPAGIQLYPPKIYGAPEVRCCKAFPSQTPAPSSFVRTFRGGSAAGAPYSPKRNSTRPWSPCPVPTHPAEVPAGTLAPRWVTLPPLCPCKHRAQGSKGQLHPLHHIHPCARAGRAGIEQVSKTHNPWIS